MIDGIELRPIPEIIGYCAGNDGNIYSFMRNGSAVGRWGWPKYQTTPKRITPNPGDYGYMQVTVCGKTMKVHILVASAFHGPRPDGKECSHLDGTKANTTPENLKWETKSANERRKAFHGTNRRAEPGENNPGAKLTWEEVRKIRELGRLGLTQRDISALFEVTRSNISMILSRVTWKEDPLESERSTEA
jgi:hypothetical protein